MNHRKNPRKTMGKGWLNGILWDVPNLVMTHITHGKITIFLVGKLNYFDWAIFQFAM